MGTVARVTTAGLVARILDYPELVQIIRELDAPVLCKLIEHVGLEDMGEVLSLVTTEQIERIFDEELWQSDESFDADRFALWLEVLLQSGEAHAVETIAGMNEDLLALGLSKNILVIDLDAMAETRAADVSDDDHLLDKALESCLSEELEEFRIIAREPRHWDAIVAVLVSLDRDHHALLRRVLERCCAASSELIEGNGGLYDVLTSEEMLESDVAHEREERRAREGYIAASDAAAFLRLAQRETLDAILGTTTADPVTKAHFRAAPSVRPAVPPSPKVRQFLSELGMAGVIPTTRQRRPLLEAQAGKQSLLRTAMSELRTRDPKRFTERLNELAYLVNVLVAACGRGDGALEPTEATEIAMRVCELGLALATQASHSGDATTNQNLAEFVRTNTLVKFFRAGWNRVGSEPWTAAFGAVFARCMSDGR